MIVGLVKTILLHRINIQKRMMYNKAESFGFTHPKVVADSQKLDSLLNRYQGIC